MLTGVNANVQKAAQRNAKSLSRGQIGLVDMKSLSPAQQLLLIVQFLAEPRWNVVTRVLELVASVAWVAFTNGASRSVVVFRFVPIRASPGVESRVRRVS